MLKFAGTYEIMTPESVGADQVTMIARPADRHGDDDDHDGHVTIIRATT